MVKLGAQLRKNVQFDSCQFDSSLNNVYENAVNFFFSEFDSSNQDFFQRAPNGDERSLGDPASEDGCNRVNKTMHAEGSVPKACVAKKSSSREEGARGSRRNK